MPSAPSAHAVRNPGRQVQLSRRRVGKSNAARASDTLRLAQARGRKVDFHDAIDKEFSDRNASVARIAKEYSKKETYVRNILCSVSQFKTKRAPTLRNAVLHQRGLEQAEGNKKTMLELRADLAENIEDGSLVLGDIEDKERDRLITQLLDHRKLKSTGVRGTTRASQLDARRSATRIGDALVDLYERTGVRGVAFFSRGNADDPALPHCVDSDEVMKFLLEVLEISPLDFLRKFEQWNCTRDDGTREKNGTNDVRKEVGKPFQGGLKQPRTPDGVHQLQVAIREGKGVELAGWPTDIKIKDRAEWSVETARRLRDMYRSGAIHWVAMTRTQHATLVAEHNARREALGAGSLKTRKERSDKGVPRGPHKGKTAAAKKKPAAYEEDSCEDEEDEDESGEKGGDTPAGAVAHVGEAIASVGARSSTTEPIPPFPFDLAAYPELQTIPDYNPDLELDPELMSLIQAGLEGLPELNMHNPSWTSNATPLGSDAYASQATPSINTFTPTPTPSPASAPAPATGAGPLAAASTNDTGAGSKRKRPSTSKDDDKEDAPLAKKSRKKRSDAGKHRGAENTPTAGDALPKTRKKRSDAGKPRKPSGAAVAR
ncbi:hypothetical protein K438DRAFT_1763168 [Mycena galopus ATCC 62051]|nr:hypothetical protein K438DRAFT_1763168 [Mycena galopus ATCC 62051]